MSRVPSHHHQYAVAVVFAMEVELNAFRFMLDEEYPSGPSQPRTDPNRYIFGRVGPHNVVLVRPPERQGKAAANSVVTHLSRTFPIRWYLLIGVGGGVPGPRHDIQLGDVVISMPTTSNTHSGIVQYDLGKGSGEGFQLKGFLKPPPSHLVSIVSEMKTNYVQGNSQIEEFLRHMIGEQAAYRQPERSSDILFPDDVPHVKGMETCGQCDHRTIPRRPLRHPFRPQIHCGLIASGDEVVVTVERRRELIQRVNGDVLCFEMEAAGVSTDFECLIVRGISDYADPHKLKGWQPYASATAAACAKQLLCMLRQDQVEERQLIAQAPQTIPSNKFASGILPAQTLRESLQFNKIKWRENNVDMASSGTCKWLQDTPQYIQWMANNRLDWHQGLLWIQGSAGTGKSTLMKFAVDEAHKRSNTGLVLSHFFNARGQDPLEHSIQGMYRTLIVCLLDRLPPGLVEELEKEFNSNAPGGWTVPQLVRLLKAATSHRGSLPITFFIDALDECDIQEVRKMLRVFRDMVKQAWISHHHIRVCFASRPYPRITFPEAVLLDLTEQKHHIQDIANYIHDHLHIEDSIAAHEIHSELLRKAAGNFLWTVLVVDILNREYDDGNGENLHDQLGQIPPELSDLFSQTLERYPDDQDALLACFRWLFFCTCDEGDSPEMTWWAVQASLGVSEDEISRKLRHLTVADMEKYLIRITKGLVEIKGYRCQFIHESIRDFIFQEGELQKRYGAQDPLDFEGQSHVQLRDWCFGVLKARRSQIQGVVEKNMGRDSLPEDFEGWADNAENEIPRYFYVASVREGMWQHAEEAQRCGKDQTAFLYSLPDEIGPFFLVEPDWGVSEWSACRSPISVLLLEGCPTLIRQTQRQAAQRARTAGLPFGLVDEGGQDFNIDVLTESKRAEAFTALLNIYLELEPRHPDLQELLEVLVTRALKRGHSFSFRAEGYHALLDVAAVDANLASFFLLVLSSPAELLPFLSTLKPLVDTLDGPPQFAQMLRFFIRQQVPTDAIDLTDPRTLFWAENRGFMEAKMGKRT